MALVQKFEELWIWQEARELVKLIYQDFGYETLGQNDYGFKGQIQRAGVSIMNNIAEGFERRGKALPDIQKHFEQRLRDKMYFYTFALSHFYTFTLLIK